MLDEGDKRESVTLRTAKGHRVVLSDYKDAADIEIRSTDGKVSISIDSDTGAIKLRSTTNGSISIEAPGGQVTIEATNVSIKAAGTLNLEGQNVAITGHQSVRIN